MVSKRSESLGARSGQSPSITESQNSNAIASKSPSWSSHHIGHIKLSILYKVQQHSHSILPSSRQPSPDLALPKYCRSPMHINGSNLSGSYPIWTIRSALAFLRGLDSLESFYKNFIYLYITMKTQFLHTQTLVNDVRLSHLQSLQYITRHIVNISSIASKSKQNNAIKCIHNFTHDLPHPWLFLILHNICKSHGLPHTLHYGLTDLKLKKQVQIRPDEFNY